MSAEADPKDAPIGMILPFMNSESVPEGWLDFDGSIIDPDEYSDLWNLLYAYKDGILGYWKEMGGLITEDAIILPAVNEDDVKRLVGVPVFTGTTLAIKAKRSVTTVEDQILYDLQNEMNDAS